MRIRKMYDASYNRTYELDGDKIGIVCFITDNYLNEKEIEEIIDLCVDEVLICKSEKGKESLLKRTK